MTSKFKIFDPNQKMKYIYTKSFEICSVGLKWNSNLWKLWHTVQWQRKQTAIEVSPKWIRWPQNQIFSLYKYMIQYMIQLINFNEISSTLSFQWRNTCGVMIMCSYVHVNPMWSCYHSSSWSNGFLSLSETWKIKRFKYNL